MSARSLLLIAYLLIVVLAPTASFAQTQERTFTGGLEPIEAAAPLPVRNAAAIAGEEIVALRYFKIEKGSFEPFLDASIQGVWPYFEKLGARVMGMWRVIGVDGPPTPGQANDRNYDEVYLATRYRSLDHWRMTRETVKHGGNGPDWDACKAALDLRRGLTESSHVIFLQGSMAPNGPYFMPGLGERYELE